MIFHSQSVTRPIVRKPIFLKYTIYRSFCLNATSSTFFCVCRKTFLADFVEIPILKSIQIACVVFYLNQRTVGRFGGAW